MTNKLEDYVESNKETSEGHVDTGVCQASCRLN
jgi:hypothetical protein